MNAFGANSGHQRSALSGIKMPEKQGLYDPAQEHDACGVGFVANFKGAQSHEILQQGLRILENLEHRGAVGADELAGDGSGILIQIPDAFLREETAKLGFVLPTAGDYAVGMVFLPKDAAKRRVCEEFVEKFVFAEGQTVLGWRDVPVNSEGLGATVKATEPKVRQIFIGIGENVADQAAFERKLFVIRKQIANGDRARKIDPGGDFFTPSMSSRTIVYKGMLLAAQVGSYYTELMDPRVVTALALVHQRFSTNTFPSWRLAHPYRMIAHNGEINTLRGNINWMTARRHSMKSDLFGNDLSKLWPLIPEGQSDTACFDNALELLFMGGYSLAHAMMLLIPEAWGRNPLMDESRRDFYEYHAALMEPWDGPAAVAFTDGRQIGATLDRNGLRPARYIVTEDDVVVMASECGVLDDIPESRIVKKWRLQPGKMLLIDMVEGRIIDDDELKGTLSSAKPYREWLAKTQIRLEDLPDPKADDAQVSETELLKRQQAFGYTQEDLSFFLEPAATKGEDPIGSMGRDTPISVLSNRPKLLYTYFKQCFAQVTNPPIDAIREELVTSLVTLIGPRPNLLGLEQGGSHWRLEAQRPIVTDEEMHKIRHISDLVGDRFKSHTLDSTYPAEEKAKGMELALRVLCRAAEEAVNDGDNILILSDRKIGPDRIAIPALLATAAVHHHLVRRGLRTEVGLIVETGEAREVHHMCLLAGYGAEAINPYLAFETLEAARPSFPGNLSAEEVKANYVKAMNKGILKVMSKMGISTYQSYCGAQIFDSIGLSSLFVERYFVGTSVSIEGIGLAEVARETYERHRLAFSDGNVRQTMLEPGGEYQYRLRGEEHAWSPDSIAKLQHAARGDSREDYAEFARHINEQSERLLTIRGLMVLRPAAKPVPLDEVEPAAEIVKRFVTGAMSFGSISHEAHTSLAIAMNRIGGKSNTGEGGEETDRFTPLPNGDSMRSAIKQVASGRFGVTAEYLVNADDLQIKIAQGAKPGEGGQLPGHKVNSQIAKVRQSTPGVGLISPPPHHDIYSIEDIAQLIHDLKNVNPGARVSVKLVSEVGVGTIAAGVAKARSDHVTISGYEGGTGASPLTSVTHAGLPWEIGLAETQQTLVLNNLRSRIVVQVDGGFRTGRDVAIGALLGADEFGFSTAPLITLGCIMMRKCHLNTCPVGVATQDPELRKRFSGNPDHVVNYFFMVAEELREIMAEMGFRNLKDMTGRVDRLDTRKAVSQWKAQGVVLSKLFHRPDVGPEIAIHHREGQDHQLDKALDNMLIEKSQPALENGTPVKIDTPITNRNRTFGTMLSGEIAKKYGHKGLPEDTISIVARGSAGQSFGAFLARGISLELVGEANDYLGKGLSGGRIAVYLSEESKLTASENIAVGNTLLYGAIAGECYVSGVAGERFGVRNSGAVVVVEGVGDHGCEYMTGGCVVVLGKTGRNFAAGMSGGISYVLDEEGDFDKRCNMQMVELEAVKSDANGTDRELKGPLLGDPLLDDETRLKRLIERHMHYTRSERAKHILDNWDSFLSKFIKIVPTDYRRALTESQFDAGSPPPSGEVAVRGAARG
ncbi:MAG: glutamate synthase large subunit [Rhodospirillaceae bacterium]|nr:glutamate synthase large subunit [Rhodospirillaceae bacterium]